MTMMIDLSRPCSQAVFAGLVGLTQPTVSRLQADGVIQEGATLGAWLLAYCDRLREQAAGRLGSEVGGLDLVQERAALARSQREAQEMRNAVARGEYAPIDVLSDVLALASSSVADRFDQIEGALRKALPDVDDIVMTTVLAVVTSARNEWVRATSRLVDAAVDDMADQDDDPDADEALDLIERDQDEGNQA
jgi:phage terminase Nu1 subunit (DNA packaging protein)